VITSVTVFIECIITEYILVQVQKIFKAKNLQILRTKKIIMTLLQSWKKIAVAIIRTKEHNNSHVSTNGWCTTSATKLDFASFFIKFANRERKKNLFFFSNDFSFIVIWEKREKRT